MGLPGSLIWIQSRDDHPNSPSCPCTSCTNSVTIHEVRPAGVEENEHVEMYDSRDRPAYRILCILGVAEISTVLEPITASTDPAFERNNTVSPGVECMSRGQPQPARYQANPCCTHPYSAVNCQALLATYCQTLLPEPRYLHVRTAWLWRGSSQDFVIYQVLNEKVACALYVQPEISVDTAHLV